MLRRSTLATACFLALAVALLVGGALLVGSALRRAARGPSAAAASTPALCTPTPAPFPSATPVAAREAGALFVPQATPGAGASPPPSSAPSPSPLPTLSPTHLPSPLPTLPPLLAANAFHASCMDVALYGFDADGALDWCHLIRCRGGRASVLSLPKNARRDALSAPLSSARGVRQAARLTESVFPQRIPAYVALEVAHIGDLVDALGGVTVNGRPMDGAAAETFLAEGGAEELLRIERRHAVFCGLYAAARDAGWWRLVSLKLTTQAYLTTNLTLSEYADLYAALRVLDADEIAYTVLPVDSVSLDGGRYYVPDAALVTRLLHG